MLNAAELDEIKLGLRDGLRGPILLKWCRLLLAEREELATRLHAAQESMSSCTCRRKSGRPGSVSEPPRTG